MTHLDHLWETRPESPRQPLAFEESYYSARLSDPVMADEGEVEDRPRDAKFEVYGQEMIEKVVKRSGNSGRVYLPPDWVGKRVKIIRVE